MGVLVIQFSALLFAVAGLALIVGAKRLAGRILIVGLILATAAVYLDHQPRPMDQPHAIG